MNNNNKRNNNKVMNKYSDQATSSEHTLYTPSQCTHAHKYAYTHLIPTTVVAVETFFLARQWTLSAREERQWPWTLSAAVSCELSSACCTVKHMWVGCAIRFKEQAEEKPCWGDEDKINNKEKNHHDNEIHFKRWYLYWYRYKPCKTHFFIWIVVHF